MAFTTPGKTAYTQIKEPLDFIIIDGPPGSACPMISTISDTDYILLVTEPTPTALHDLDHVVKIIKFFNIPTGAVINKADIHKSTYNRIRKYLQENNITLHAEIPYNKIIPKAIAEGKPFNYFSLNPQLNIQIQKIINEVTLLGGDNK